jgi:hypothetical protein
MLRLILVVMTLSMTSCSAFDHYWSHIPRTDGRRLSDYNGSCKAECRDANAARLARRRPVGFTTTALDRQRWAGYLEACERACDAGY